MLRRRSAYITRWCSLLQGLSARDLSVVVPTVHLYNAKAAEDEQAMRACSLESVQRHRIALVERDRSPTGLQIRLDMPQDLLCIEHVHTKQVVSA